MILLVRGGVTGSEGLEQVVVEQVDFVRRFYLEVYRVLVQTHSWRLCLFVYLF